MRWEEASYTISFWAWSYEWSISWGLDILNLESQSSSSLCTPSLGSQKRPPEAVKKHWVFAVDSFSSFYDKWDSEFCHI